ncbi:ATPase family AAA domain-containing protein 5 [Discoglossus pictus]
MAGVLTMSAVVEDYNAQPCKKQRKDEDPPIKTITNYFSPLSKNTEKVLTSPRSNSITDYFKRTSLACDKEQTSNTSKSNCNSNRQTEANCDTIFSSSPVADCAKAGTKLKKRGKRINLSKKLNDLKPNGDCDLAEDYDHNENPATDNVCGSTGFMGSDTAALLAEICRNEDLDDHNKPESTVSKAAVIKNTSKTNKETSTTDENNCSKARHRKPDRGKAVQLNNTLEKSNNDYHTEQPAVMSNTSLESKQDSKSTVGDSSLDVNVSQTSHENSSIEVVSFEDFLKSQAEKDQLEGYKGAMHNSVLIDDNSETATSAEMGTSESSQQVSPKTMTVHAQVHLSTLPNSPLQNSKAAKKIAAIFLKKKDGGKVAEEPVIDLEQTDQVIQKRKSNVVISEDELELAVLETENVESVKQKSTAEERQQFMNAFRRQTETVKTGGKKSLQKQKDSNVISKEDSQGIDDVTVEKPHALVDDDDIVNEEDNKLVKTKLKKKTKTSKQNIDTILAEKVSSNEKDATIEKAKKPKKSNGSIEEVRESPVSTNSLNVRRSSRCRKSTQSPVKKLSDTDSPVQVSTPKVKIPCRKTDLYKVEVLTDSSETQSPIRMRFTRLSARRGGRRRSLEEELFTPRSKKVTGEAKKIRQAKKLLEKAKAIKQNIKSETLRRRSSRQHTLSEKRLSPEDCIIVADNTPDKSANSSRKAGKNKNLRSLNDVLGKNAKLKKKTNTSSGQTQLSGKQLKKLSTITIVDDSSLDASENSQDDEQFKSKREFLMSGLPDSLKRHIAKTAAIMEAYSVSSSSFQNVAHVQQKDDCQMWNLPMPLCPRLNVMNHLSIAVTDIAKLKLSLGEFTYVNIRPIIQPPESLMNGRRKHISASVKDNLLEEICSCNPPFPVKLFFKQFLKKQFDQLLNRESSKQDCPLLEKTKISLDTKDISQVDVSDTPEIGNRAKRKRKDSPAVNAKRRRSSSNVVDQNDQEGYTEPDTLSQSSTRGHLSRKARKKQVCEEKESPLSIDCKIIEEKDTEVPAPSVDEDVLWTEKYQPQNSGELIGNSNAVKRLHSWLKEWKMRAEKEEKRNLMRKTEKDKQDTWDHSDFDSSDDEEESLCNTVLITGPSGVGKTAAVYACAIELGFKVFEVNASCQRSGRQILAQLKEATQSHQVDQKGVNIHKPCFFNSHSAIKSPRKLNSPRNVSSPRKPPSSPRGPGLKKGLAPKSLANFFKVQPKQKNLVKSKIQDVPKAANEIVTEHKGTENKGTKNKIPIPESGQACDESQRKTATSLILFEEVDVIFDDDSGFLAAIKTFMATTKRPVVLTTNDPTFDLMFDGTFEKIIFKPPSLINVASFLRVLCLAENLRTDSKDFATFLTINKCDIRRSMLNLQFWAKSGGGNLMDKQLLCGKEIGASSDKAVNSGTFKKDAIVKKGVSIEFPKCNTGFFTYFIGLCNLVPPIEGLISFVKRKIAQKEEWDNILQLLAEFQRNKIYFISSNLECLLPLPLRFQETNNTTLPDTQVEVCPLKVSEIKSRKKMFFLNDSDLFENDSNSDELLTLQSVTSKQSHNEDETDTQEGSKVINQNSQPSFEKRKLTPAEQESSNLVFQCLNTIAEFMDNMSYLDCCTFTDIKEQDYFGKNGNLNWTESKVKNGLCDELRIESRDWWSSQSCFEVKAGIEAFAFHKCSVMVSKAINKSLDLCKVAGNDPTEELTLNVSKDRNEVSFHQSSIFASIAEQRVSDVKTVFSNRSFVTLGNRQANVTEYLPALRSICRLEKSKEQGKAKRRFLHYFEGIHLELPKAIMNNLAANFP